MDTRISFTRFSAVRHLFPALGVGLVVSASGFAQDTPAARLRIAQPTTAVLPVARGVYPDAPVTGFAPAPAAAAPSFVNRISQMFTAPVSSDPSGPLGLGILPSALGTVKSGAASTPSLSAPAFPALPAPALSAPTLPAPTFPVSAMNASATSATPKATSPTSIDRTWDQLKTTVFPPSNSAPPKFESGDWNPFDSGTTPKAAAAPPPAPTAPAQPVALPAVVNPTTFAAPPAYRWYGWGTTVPGANPYAPGGKSPQGSAGWYSQSRATPGAFPGQVVATAAEVNPASPPAYAHQPSLRATEKPFRAATRLSDLRATEPVSASPPAVSVPQPPVHQPVPAPAPSRTVPTQPVIQTQHPTPLPPPPGFRAPQNPGSQLVPIAVSHSSAMPTPGQLPVASAGLTWKPVSLPNPVPSTVPVSPATPVPRPATIVPPRVEIETSRSEPAPLPVSITVSPEQIQRLVTAACADWVKNVEVRLTGSTKVVVRYTAFSESHAHAAAEAVSRIPELKGFEVGFEARVANR